MRGTDRCASLPPRRLDSSCPVSTSVSRNLHSEANSFVANAALNVPKKLAMVLDPACTRSINTLLGTIDPLKNSSLGPTGTVTSRLDSPHTLSDSVGFNKLLNNDGVDDCLFSCCGFACCGGF